MVSPQTPFGFVTSFKGHKKDEKNTIQLFISGGSNYISKDKIQKGAELINKYKVFIPKAGSGSDKFPHTILGQPFVGKPNTVCNQTYLAIGPFMNSLECNNMISYIRTKFFRFMVLLKKNTQDAMRGVYSFVPMQDFSEPWTDEKLYAKYGLTQEEIAFIESMIRPMEVE
jgi:site-specific DNA-methyltransferase (adenine-specific)